MILNELKRLVDNMVEAGHGKLTVMVDVGFDDLTYYADATSLEVCYLGMDGSPFSEEFFEEDERKGDPVIALSGYMGE